MGEVTLPDGVCAVWWASPRSAGLCLLRVLDAAESHRWRRFRHDADRARMLTGVALAKTLLAGPLGVAPHEVRFERTCERCGRPHGKPRPATPATGLHFSISHSGDRVAVAVTTAAPVGVDVEGRADGSPLLRTARAVLTDAEFSRWARLPPQRRHPELVRAWTRKESLLKATGHGLALPLDRIGVTGTDGRPVLRDWPPDAPRPTARLYDLRPGVGYHACVAVLSTLPCRIEEHDGDELLRHGH